VCCTPIAVQAGFARSLAQPGGNITGFLLDQPNLAGKWLELIRESVPGTRRIAVLVDTATRPRQLASIKRATEKLRIDRPSWVATVVEQNVSQFDRTLLVRSSPGQDKSTGSRHFIRLAFCNVCA